jgi:predicted RNase H-like HicB family nuclease
MFTEYVAKAMRKAAYELIEDGTFFGSIPGFDGVWGNATSLEECREELQETLEGWLILKLWLNDEDIPVLGKLRLTPKGLPPHRRDESSLPSRTRKAS